jgi:ligand-binding sensor domain-containing protein
MVSIIRSFIFSVILLSSVFAGPPDFFQIAGGAKVTAFVKDGTDFWLATYGNGIFRYDTKSNELISMNEEEGGPKDRLIDCIEANDDFVWAGTSDGLLIYDKEKESWKKRKFAEGGEYGNWIRGLKYDESTGLLWIGRFINMTILNVKRQKYEDFNLARGNESSTNNVKRFFIEEDRYVWIITEGGIYKFDKTFGDFEPSRCEFISNKDGAFRSEGMKVSVNSILFDNEFIWFGNQDFRSLEMPDYNVGGVYRFNRMAKWDKVDSRSGLRGDGVYSMMRIGNTVWAATYEFDKEIKKEYGRGVTIIDRNTAKVISSNPKDLNIPANQFYAMEFDQKYIWLASENGLWRIDVSTPLASWGGKKKVDPKEEPKGKKPKNNPEKRLKK